MSNEMPDELAFLAQKIAEFREKHRLTYQELGEATGVDKSHVHRIENMAVFPSLKFLIRLAEYMNVPLFYLFLPTEKLNQRHLANQIKTRLKELGWTEEELAEKTNISALRLMDFEQENASPTLDEWNVLQEILKLKQEPDFLTMKFNLLKNLLEDLGLKEAQIENILSYIRNNVG